MAKVYLGIDPGKLGGLALLLPRDVVVATRMPTTDRDLLDWINRTKQHGEPVCILEKVWGYLGKGTAKPGKFMFTFGEGYGKLCMALTATRIPYETVTPANWQKSLHVVPRGKKEPKAKFKARLKARAQQLYPKLSVTLPIADAILIATYAKRLHKGVL